MGIQNKTRARGLVGVRADASDAKSILENLQKTFEAFKAEHQTELDGIKKNFADVVQTEKVDRINNEITKLQGELDVVNRALAALKVGGAGPEGETAERRAHAKAFDRFFRKGVDADLRDLEVKAALRTDSDPDGGYIVPTQMEQTIDRVLGTVSALRSISRVMQISSSEYKKLVNLGGASSGWVGERESRTETDTPTLSALSFPAMELYAMPGATQRMLDDGMVNVEQWLADEVSIEFAEEEGSAFVSGNGVNKPRGILAYDTVANASYTWGKLGYVATGQAADWATVSATVARGDVLIDCYYALKAGYRQNATWVMSDAVMGAVRKFKANDGTYLWSPPSAPGELPTILGKPVVTDDNMQAVAANAYPIAFGDFNRGYMIVDRTGIRVLRDPYTSKGNVLFYTTKRVGGGVQNFEAIKLVKIASS